MQALTASARAGSEGNRKRLFIIVTVDLRQLHAGSLPGAPSLRLAVAANEAMTTTQRRIPRARRPSLGTVHDFFSAAIR